MTAYYNEIDPFAAQWLRELIKAGHIAPGDVDTRSIVDVRPDDLKDYTQCHFFAGIGVWSYALRRAGWPDDRPVWTGSCPCQPFSGAGKGAGFADERHLWPAFYHLIGECRPAVVLGEQVEGKDGLAWLDLVQVDLEAVDYACGAVVAPSAGFGAPHGRHRQYWMADAQSGRRHGRSGAGRGDRTETIHDSEPVELADAAGSGQSRQGGCCAAEGQGAAELRGVGSLADTASGGREPISNVGPPSVQRTLVQPEGWRVEPGGLGAASRDALASGPTNGVWGAADWLYCRDGKWRPVEPGAFPLAHGAAARVGRLRGYGNAINAEQATAFVEACIAARPYHGAVRTETLE